MDRRSNYSEKLIKIEDRRESRALSTDKCSKSSRDGENLQLIEDVFGVYYDEKGNSHNIKRFTWKNRNKIQVQVINYGARIISMKLPDRKGEIEDIVLGFDDLAGYIHYKKNYFGATIGRMTGIVKNSSFIIDNQQYLLRPNQDPDHFNGGQLGLDQAVWTTYVDDKKVIMSYVSPNLTEGYPGDLFIRVTFELSTRNEFNIQMDAQCTQPTIVNLSNLTYFNLAGHYQGPDHIYRHIVTLNCNCFTPMINNLPTGEIVNVVHTAFDFQIPKMLGKVMGIIPKDGFNQNLCINRGMDQEDCLVARVLHPPSGRMLEIYSNQWGVNFSTANEFGYGRVLSVEELVSEEDEKVDPTLELFEKVHKHLVNELALDEKNNYEDIRALIEKIKEKHRNRPQAPPSTPVPAVINDGLLIEDSTEASKNEVSKSEASKIGVPKTEISKTGVPKTRVSNNVVSSIQASKTNVSIPKQEDAGSVLTLTDVHFTPLQINYLKSILTIMCDEYEEEECVELKKIISKILQVAIVEETHHDKAKAASKTDAADTKCETRPETTKPIKKNNNKNRTENVIPFYYRNSNQIIGKERAPYRMHGGIAVQTQNYPGCANFKNFPNCVLRPGETYKHTITYKFWIRAGNPNKWIKRNLNAGQSKLLN